MEMSGEGRKAGKGHGPPFHSLSGLAWLRVLSALAEGPRAGTGEAQVWPDGWMPFPAGVKGWVFPGRLPGFPGCGCCPPA